MMMSSRPGSAIRSRSDRQGRFDGDDAGSRDALGTRILSEPDGPKRLLGARGEVIAERYLAQRGVRILERGFRVRSGEIDLIAEEGEELVFVEVKTRTSSRFGDPLDAVTPAKRRRIVRAASLYLQSKGAWDRPCRFDLIAVRLAPDGQVEVEHLPGAFTAET